MKSGINYFLALGFFLLTAFLSGCATKTVKEGAFQKAQWETKAMIKNLKENKNQSLTIDIYAIKNERARFEISALLGYQVASLVMSPSDISYAIYPQKTFFYGKNSDRAFRRIIDLPLHPMNLANIAFDEPIRGPGWKCTLGADGFLTECENIQRQMKAVWSDRKEGKKKVVLTGPQFEMQWHFGVPQTEVQFKDDLFTLRQPSGFKAIQIN
ncbi:hypothetical protein AZI86_07705 [Bdellovibrio bacteriovorus]|uniref:Lipoprotein n=1 Tax=Bdellovibrio bacteriovorus TaxID=959 RepID=A0A150WRS8_BDEBC|nr:hypothetical protein [Bdellovibrio bacteriovorus]KYG66905.1 hypothetical protein AZI86_07705 [Bdellovibrio bacteriovorus]